RLAHRRQAGAELVGELPRDQPFAGTQPALEQRLLERALDEAGEAALRRRCEFRHADVLPNCRPRSWKRACPRIIYHPSCAENSCGGMQMTAFPMRKVLLPAVALAACLAQQVPRAAAAELT